MLATLVRNAPGVVALGFAARLTWVGGRDQLFAYSWPLALLVLGALVYFAWANRRVF